MEKETTMWFRFCAVTIYDRSCHNIGVIGVCAADRDSSAAKVHISIAIAGVSAGFNLYDVAVIGIVNCRLDIIKIRRAIVINGDCSCPAGND